MLGRRDQIRRRYKYPSGATLSKLLVIKSHSNWLSFLVGQRSPLLKLVCKVTLCLCFHLCIHPSEARKSVNSRLLARLRAYTLITFGLTGMLFEHAFLNQVKTASFRSLLTLFFKIFRLEFTWPDSYAWIIFVLFVIHFDILFFFTLYSSTTFSFFFLLATLYILCDWNVDSFHLNKICNCSGLCCTTESLNFMSLKIAKIRILMFHLNGSE